MVLNARVAAQARLAGEAPTAGDALIAPGDRIVAGGDMSEAVTALRHDSAERRRATYQDVLDAPVPF